MDNNSAIFIEEVLGAGLAVASSQALALDSAIFICSTSSGVGPSSSTTFGFTLKSPPTGNTCTLVFSFSFSEGMLMLAPMVGVDSRLLLILASIVGETPDYWS